MDLPLVLHADFYEQVEVPLRGSYDSGNRREVDRGKAVTREFPTGDGRRGIGIATSRIPMFGKWDESGGV